MRITDDRYSGELARFELAMRMIRLEARTGTIRACTGFSEDRVRKLVGSYCRTADGLTVRRRRGKSPRRIDRFVGNAWRQAEATLLALLFVYTGALRLAGGELRPTRGISAVSLGERLCQAYETYARIKEPANLSFEWAWSLYHALVAGGELYFSYCDACELPYVQDRFALDYRRCPTCEIVSRKE
ncbi:MAG: hypothetical protein D6727_04575 [Gammaproteobacteria bacterium]|nr:MAG: hypothetical protein D6727_04575 [Gammaproteobacteria bacterium]